MKKVICSLLLVFSLGLQADPIDTRTEVLKEVTRSGYHIVASTEKSLIVAKIVNGELTTLFFEFKQDILVRAQTQK